MSKQKIYERFIERQQLAYDNGYYFESAWYAYAIVEDRAMSMLSQTGKPSTDKMLGSKLKKLRSRMSENPYLEGALLKGEIIREVENWKEDRNKLMHQMADGKTSLEDIEAASKILAEVGLIVVRNFSSAARRFKKTNKI